MIINDKTNWPFFEYDTGMEIRIAYLDDNENQEMVTRSTKTVYKKHQKSEEIDLVKLRERICNKVLVGWNIKKKHVPQMIQPTKEMKLEENESWDDDFPYSKENRSLIIENLNYQFGEWIVAMAKDVAAYEAARKAQEKKNLPPGSTTREAKKD